MIGFHRSEVKRQAMSTQHGVGTSNQEKGFQAPYDLLKQLGVNCGGDLLNFANDTPLLVTIATAAKVRNKVNP